MGDRVRVLVNGRLPYVDSPTPANDDTTDFAKVFPGGIIVADPTVPEDLGTEPITSQAPAAPGTPTVTTGQATDHVYVNATWAAAADQTVPAAQYEVYVNVSGQNPTIFRVAGNITAIRIAPAKPSTTYQVKVRAISRLEVAGSYSSYGSTTSAAFVVPTVTFAPTTPSAPTVTAAVYTLLVVWTALTDVTSGYGHYDVQIATDSGFTLNVRTRSVDGTIASFTDLTPGTTYYARVRGVAPDGTTGSWSSGSSVATTKVVAGDITANTITAAQIAADTITAAQLAADSITASELSAINLAVGKYLRSTSYTPGSSGWSINADGTAEFQSVTARGYLLGSNIVQSEGGDLLNNGGGAPADYDGDLSSQQIITNPKFETNITGWQARANCTVARITSQFHSGAACMEATGTNTTQSSISSDATNGNRFPVTVGRVYTASAWVRTAATARSTAVGIVWYDAGNSILSTSFGSRVNDATTWGQRSVSATAPANAVTCTVIVEFGTTTGAVSEKHQVDDMAFWDKTAFLNLGWSFHANVTPSLSYDLSGVLSILCNMATDVTDVWYIESPAFTIDATRAYRAGFTARPNETVSESYSGQAQLVFNKAGTPETDGAIASPQTSIVVATTLDNFSSGGDGIATAVTPTTVCARFGHPYAPVNILSPGNVWLRGFTLQTSGQVTGHINPAGPVQGFTMGRYGVTTTTGGTTAATNVETLPTQTLSGIIAASSTPGAYSDTSRARLIYINASAAVTNVNTTEVQLLLRYSLDGGTTYNNLHRARFQTVFGNGGYEETMFVQGVIFCPAGVDPKISILEQHTLTTTSNLFSDFGLVWIVFPA